MYSTADRLSTHASSEDPAPLITTGTVIAASTPLRAIVRELTGSEATWPKQLQSGVRPCERESTMPAMNTSSSARAAMPPQRAEPAPRRVRSRWRALRRAVALPAIPAYLGGTPNSIIVRMEPDRSSSFATAATVKTIAMKARARSANGVHARMLAGVHVVPGNSYHLGNVRTGRARDAHSLSHRGRGLRSHDSHQHGCRVGLGTDARAASARLGRTRRQRLRSTPSTRSRTSP